MAVKSSIKPTKKNTINNPKQKSKTYAIPDKAKPVLLSGVIIAASVAFFPQEPLYQFLLTTKTWKSHTQVSLETRYLGQKPLEDDSDTQMNKLVKQQNKPTRYYINTSSQMVFLPNKQYQKATLVSYTSPSLKPSQFEYIESGSWSISGQYIEANPKNISDNSLNNQMVDLLQRNNLLDIKAKQTYHMNFDDIKKATINNLSFESREYH
ncbi:regulatory protein ToxS [Photobacterium sanguinicancri]|uniref:regulatory protein ToxS n=1 Tax=Photobacterium sanguinicancri TaxID=875932 RepID=UPI0026E1EB1E|nr:regulatory protein ToxS [Photobacterium sanguinicancri]MDO6496779.1 regulatory protein ToxS [Photobacterium sanguinicancri]